MCILIDFNLLSWVFKLEDKKTKYEYLNKKILWIIIEHRNEHSINGMFSFRKRNSHSLVTKVRVTYGHLKTYFTSNLAEN